jgi:GAF domain-containing protein
MPLFDSTRQPVGVLDIDSTELATFDEIDRINLQRVCQLITETLYKQ